METRFLSIAILDSYLSLNPVSRLEAQLVALSCVNLACKLNERFHTSVEEYSFIANEAFTVERFVEMEQTIITSLQGDFNFPSLIQAIRMISNKIIVSPRVHELCKFMAEHIMLTHEYSLYYPSVLATAIHFHACELEKVSPHNIFGIDSLLLDQCMNWLKFMLGRIVTTKFHNIRAYYPNVDANLFVTDIVFDPSIISICLNHRPKSIVRANQPLEVGNYREKVAQGTHGIVYKVVGKDNMMYACKKLFHEEPQFGFTADVLREISMMKLVEHPNVLGMHSFSLKDKKINIFMDFAQTDLNKYIKDHLGGISESLQSQFITDLINGLAYLHGLGIIHRDIKSQNILLFEDKDSVTLKYADFGLVRGPGIALCERWSEEVITMWYRPPELMLGIPVYDERVDIWSLGCVIYEIVCRSRLFPANREIEQLDKIFEVMGTPTEDSWPEMKEYRYYKDLEFVKHEGKKPFEEITNPLFKTILERCLTMRISETAPKEEQRAYISEIKSLLEKKEEKVDLERISTLTPPRKENKPKITGMYVGDVGRKQLRVKFTVSKVINKNNRMEVKFKRPVYRKKHGIITKVGNEWKLKSDINNGVILFD
jgi:serine/threonine protein kinase